jgi:hypothetical protein
MEAVGWADKILPELTAQVAARGVYTPTAAAAAATGSHGADATHGGPNAELYECAYFQDLTCETCVFFIFTLRPPLSPWPNQWKLSLTVTTVTLTLSLMCLTRLTWTW